MRWKKEKVWRFGLSFGLICLSILGSEGKQPAPPSWSAPSQTKKISSLAPQNPAAKVYFISNQGQFPRPVKFVVQDKEKAVFFASEDITFLLPGEKTPWAVKIKFLGARREITPVAWTQPEATFSYFQGSEVAWKTSIPAYKKICYPEVWPGIDLLFSGSAWGLKSEFLLRPGANPADIRLAVEGISAAAIDERGRLVLRTPAGSIVEEIPLAYQEINGKRVEIEVNYKLEALPEVQDLARKEATRTETAENSMPECRQSKDAFLGHNYEYVPCSPYDQDYEDDYDPGYEHDYDHYHDANYFYGFSFGPYDPSQPLIIDPITLVAGNYIGGTSFDYAYGIALDSAGYVYIAGYTYSASSFPLKAGPQLGFKGGDVDAFVAKFDPVSSQLVYCGFLGGDDRDFAYDIAVDDEGNAYVVGYTSSTENSFPVTKGPGLIASGLYDAFVAKINPTGTKLLYCGFLGGAANDFGRSIAVDEDGRAYITGYTLSSEATFPVKVGPELTFKGHYDAFIARVASSGEELDYCGYIGGDGNDWGYGVAVDPEGGAYIAGMTNSTETTFPVLSGPDLTINGQMDAFVAKVSPSGETLVYCGYIGGDGEDAALAMAVDQAGWAYVTGYTSSREDKFSAIFGPDLSYNGGYYDAFVAKVWPDGSYLAYCGYIGGAGYEAGNGISVDNWGCAYVTGFTSSEADSFPVKEGPELSFQGSFDAFIAKVQSSGASLEFGGYLGGTAADYGQDIVVEKGGSGTIYFTGTTYSPELSFPAPLATGLTFQGKRDVFLARYQENSLTVTSPNGGETWYYGFEVAITWRSVGEVGPVRLELSTDNGETWQEIEAETENDGYYEWVVPDINSSSCRIRVSEADDGIPSDTSDYVFAISNAPVIRVISPNGGEEWPVGSVQEIIWKTGAAPVGDIKIEYSTDNGTNWIEIVAQTENDGVFEWEVPDTVSSQCLVRISEAEDADPMDVSDAPFSIVPADEGSAKAKDKPEEKKNELRLMKKESKRNSESGSFK